MTVQDLTDAILRHALELQRLADHDGEEAARLLTQLEEELRALAASKTLSEANKREVDAIIAQAQEAIEARYGQVSGVVDMQGVVAVVAENTAEAMQSFYPQASTPERLASLAREVLIEGAPTAAWWARQSEDTAFRFAQAVRQGVVEGQTQEQIVSRIAGRNGFMEIARRNARTLVHSSVMSAANQARLATFRKHMREGDALEWLATLDSSVCPVCAALDGKQWDGEGKAVRGNKFAFRVPPAHHSCFPADTPVLSRRPVTGASKRWFDGEMVVIKTASGRELSCTPNHPILTDSGWVPAGLLDVGCNVVCDGGGHGECAGDGNRQDVPTLIHDVAEPVLYSGGVEAIPVPVAAKDFHGDGGGSEIAVVWSDSFLGLADNPSLVEPKDEISFIAGNKAGLVSLPTLSGKAPFFKTANAPFGSEISSPSQLLPLVRGCPLHSSGLLGAPASHGDSLSLELPDQGRSSNTQRLGHASDPDPLLEYLDCLADIYWRASAGGMGAGEEASAVEPCDNSPIREASLFGNLPAVLPGKVHLDKIVSRNVIPFSGHVYNLETTGGWYIAQGVIVHNCRCVLTIKPGLKGIEAVDPIMAEQLRNLGGRSSQFGPTGTDTSMEGFLQRQSPQFVEGVLGRKRADLFLAGKITLNDLVTKAGRFKSLDELRAR